LIPAGLQVVIQAVIAEGQSIVQRSLGLQILGEHLLDPTMSGISIVTANGIRLLRAYGLSDHPNILGGCLAFGMLLLLAAYLYSPKPGPALAAILPGFPALLVTFSRSGWLAFLGGTTFIIGVLIINRHWTALKRLSWLFLMGFLLLIPFLLAYARFFGTRLNADNSFNTPSVEQQSIGERYLLIKSTIPIFLKHLFFGVGLGASPRALESAYPSFPVGYEPPHISMFDAALETGIPGAAFYLILIIAPFVIFFNQRMSVLSNPLSSATLVLLLSITIVGFFDYYTWYLVPGRMWQWLGWGLWAVTYKQAPALSRVPNRVSA
jgi:O-antigen ligase